MEFNDEIHLLLLHLLSDRLHLSLRLGKLDLQFIRVDQVVQFCRDHLKDALARFSPCQELLLQLLLLLLVDGVVLHGEDAFPGERL